MIIGQKSDDLNLILEPTVVGENPLPKQCPLTSATHT